MAKVIFRGLVSDDSPIYEQSLVVGMRNTAPPSLAMRESKHSSGLVAPPLDLTNLPFDPAKVAGEKSLGEEFKSRPTE